MALLFKLVSEVSFNVFYIVTCGPNYIIGVLAKVKVFNSLLLELNNLLVIDVVVGVRDDPRRCEVLNGV